jgi:hypothetical protein
MIVALFGLWWADPLAALVMVPINAKEGIEGFKAKRVMLAKTFLPFSLQFSSAHLACFCKASRRKKDR